MDMGCSCPRDLGVELDPTHKSSSLSKSVHESACEETLTHDSLSMLHSRSGSCVDDVMGTETAGGLASFDAGECLWDEYKESTMIYMASVDPAWHWWWC